MTNLFLGVFTVSVAVSVLLLPLLLCRGWLEKTYSPQTRWGLWLVIALVLIIAPWVPKPQAAVVVEAPAYTLALPMASARTQEPLMSAAPQTAPPVGGQIQPITSVDGQGQPELPTQVGAQSHTDVQPAALPVSQAARAQRAAVDLTVLLSAVWLTGLVLILVWQGSWYLLARHRLLHLAKPVTGLERYAAELGLEDKVTFYHCKAIPGPMTMGVWKPAVLLPPDGLAVVALRHELYHVKRRDVAYKALLLCACAFHWFNPLVWWLYRAANRDIEACCDAAVVEGRDSGYKRSYGELLLTTAAESQALPFTTSFGGQAEQMKARLTQLFRSGKQSKALVCLVLAMAVILGSLVACRQTISQPLPDGVYCSPYANVSWPVGEPDAEGEDYTSIRLSLLDYNETEGPHGKPLGEYTLPLSKNLMLRQTWWGEDQSAGEQGTQEWQKAVADLINMPVYRDSIPLGVDYLVVTVKNGEITRLSWALVDREGSLNPDDQTYLTPLTENTMPTLVYYDPARDFLLYHTVDTAYFHYGDSWFSYRPDQSEGKRVLWRCDVSEDEQTVYLSDVFDDSTGREERFHTWDIAQRTLQEADAIPDGIDNMTHVSPEELFYSGFMNGTSLKSNVIKTSDGTLAGLYIDELLGNSIEYLQLARMREDGAYEAEGSALGINAFLTPERIPAPRTYTDPDWGFTLQLPGSLEGNYVVSRAANNWNFYDKELYPVGGYLFSLRAEDSATQQKNMEDYSGLWLGKILGEKNGIAYTLTTWSEEYTSPAEQENEAYMTRMRDAWEIAAADLNLSAVTRSSGYLWPLPYIEYGSDVILGEEDNALRILSPEGVSVQSIAAGTVVSVTAHPVTGDITVTVAHPDGRYSEYSHLEYVQLEPGANVEWSGIIGFAKKEDGQCWLTFRLLSGGSSWDNAAAMDPWSVDYRTYDFLPVTRDDLTIAGDPKIPAALRAVLRGEATFYNTETGEYCYADALPFSDDVPVKVYRFAELDMDGDTVPEVILWLQRGDEIYLLGSMILHYQNGWVCGYPMGYRSLIPETLKVDGTFQWNSSAFNWGFAEMDFLSGEGKRTTWCENRGSQEEKYYVNGEESQVEEFEAEYQLQTAKEDVQWYEMVEENIERIY